MIDKPTTVVNLRKSRYDVYIGRGSVFGNDWSHLPVSRAKYHVSSREQAIECFRNWLSSQPELIARIKRELKGKVLGCYCKPESCHGDILAAIADGKLEL